MKKLALATAAAAALMFTAPSFTGFTTPAAAETIVKKKIVIRHGDRGRHMGWRDHRRHGKVVIIKRHRGMHHEGMHHSRTVIKKTVIR